MFARYAILAATALALAGVPVAAAEPLPPGDAPEAPGAAGSGPAPPPLPESLSDRGFDRYLDVFLLQDGLGSFDARAVTDAAMQLAEGERVLGRRHKTLRVESLLRMAALMAADKKDTETLERIAAAAKKAGNAELAGAVAAAQKLSTASRAPAPKVALDQVTPASLEVYQSYLHDLRIAKVTGDKEELSAIAGGIEATDALNAEQKKFLAAEAKAALDGVPDAPTEEMLLLQKLAATSRGTNRDDARTSVANGGWVVAYGKEVGWQQEAALVAAMVSVGPAGAAGAAQTYLGDLIVESAKTLGLSVVVQALTNRGTTFGPGKFTVVANIATYNNWHYEYPLGKKVKLKEPNSFQPYVKWKRK